MLTEIYIEALLVDEALADHIWEVWDAGLITHQLACAAWLCIVSDDDEYTQGLFTAQIVG